MVSTRPFWRYSPFGPSMASEQPLTAPSAPSATGWDTGLCQDYCGELAIWFATRLDARAVVRQWFGEQRASHRIETGGSVGDQRMGSERGMEC